ncbi:FAD-dependent oxidoreductase [Haloechinothrix halophila]|uniref:FAD-dependent oxidoreductase n=1 Tax=Haloechinothrix halophila TaxID=1069073 RepID=UPI000403C7D6|nr:FAD-dependent oxidoreductase [Haloechinothrix halophila]
MTTVAIIGDGPAGLSAALFLAKNGHQAIVYGQDKTAMHFAQLHNYLGIDNMGGTDFQTAARAQVAGFGANLLDAQVETVTHQDGRFTVHAGDDAREADYVILAGAKAARRLAEQLGVDLTDDRARVDTENRTNIDRVYAVGRLARGNRSQAIISAGAGAVAALDILSREEGKDVHDWDTPPKEGE